MPGTEATVAEKLVQRPAASGSKVAWSDWIVDVAKLATREQIAGLSRDELRDTFGERLTVTQSGTGVETTGLTTSNVPTVNPAPSEDADRGPAQDPATATDPATPVADAGDASAGEPSEDEDEDPKIAAALAALADLDPEQRAAIRYKLIGAMYGGDDAVAAAEEDPVLTHEYVVRVNVAGTRDGVPWPGIGEVIALPPEEAADYLIAGYVEPVDEF